MPKVSIIVPIYNVEQYVRKSVNSLLAQTEKDVEIILVDDGSTDDSGKICDEFAKIDTRVIVIHKINGGLSSARNVGVNIASSEYVLFLDGDDYLKKNTVERLLEIMKRYPSDFIQFRYKEVYEEKMLEADYICDKEIYQVHKSIELFENLYKLGGVAASSATKLFRRELVVEVPFISIQHEDEMWCTQAFEKDLTVTYIPDELYFYVMREGSIIHSPFNHKKLDIFLVSETRIKVLEKFKLKKQVSLEYTKLFKMIISLHNEAKNAGDILALKSIKKKFEVHKRNIMKEAVLERKFRILFYLMCLNYKFIEIYRIYWKRKV